MAISGIENINIGQQNEAAGSDSLYTAFHKSQNNFTRLFSCASPTTNFVAGNGVSVEYSNSNTYLTITNTGVTNLVAGDDSIVLTQSNGNITITAPGGGNGGGGVSNINVIGAASGARITSTGGPIISSGIITLDLANSGVTAGTYTYPTVTVDQYGRVTNIANASSLGTVTSVGVVTTGAGIQISGSPVTTSGNISIINTGVTRLNAGSGIALSSSNGNITVSMTTGAAGVTSVGISSNSLTVTNSPITSTGTMTVDLPTNTAIVGNLTVGNNLSVTGNGTITGNLTVTGNIVSSANVIGTLTANNLTVFGSSSGNSNVSTVTGDLGLRTLASTYTDNVSAAGTITTAAIHAIGVPTLAASNAVTFTNAASFYIAGGPTAGTNATITTGYALYVNSGDTYFGGANNVITGNLTVNGNTNYYNVETFVVEDPIISLGGGPNGNALTSNDGKDRGTALQYYTSTPVTAFMGWDNGNGEFSFGSNVTIASEVVTYNTLGNARGLTWLGNVVGTTANLTTGNMTTGNITTINSGLMQNGNSNISIVANSNVAIAVASSNIFVVTSTGANITGTANISGNLSAGNIPIIPSGNSNITITSNANISMFTAGNATAQFVVTSSGANIPGTANVVGNANVGNLGTATAIITTGNITTINSGLLQNGNSNITLTANGNISTFITGNATAQLVVTATGANIAGTANIASLTVPGNTFLSTASGNVGINTSSPSKKLEVYANVNSLQIESIVRNDQTGTGVAAIGFNVSGSAASEVTSTKAGIGLVRSAANGVGSLAFYNNVNSSVSGDFTTADERMRIDSVSGNVGIAQINPAYTLDVTGNIRATANIIGANLIGPHANGNSNVNIATANGNVTIAAVGNTTMTITGTGANIAGTGNITGNLSIGGFTNFSAGAGISAAGTVQANATAITKDNNQVTVVAAGSGVVLPTAVPGMRIFVRNAQAVNALLVYPAVGGTINLLAANAAFSLALSTSAEFFAVSATQWYT